VNPREEKTLEPGKKIYIHITYMKLNDFKTLKERRGRKKN
jgi:hypothetical protein